MNYIKYIFFVGACLYLCSCNIDDIANPNGSSIEGTAQDATKSQLQTLVTGSEDLLRQEIGFYYDVVSIVGREYYFMTGSDPRYTGEVLGKGESTLDNAGFYGTRPYFGRYKTIRNLNVLIEAANNTGILSTEELNGYMGFAKTFQAYELHLAANLQGMNGIRTNTSDIDNLGAFETYDGALANILSLLDEANGHLSSAGASFPFTLSSAMAGFDTPATFATFNRAISARIALYQGNTADARTRLGDSFLDMAGPGNVGPARYYSSAGGDFANNLFRVPDQADAIIAHPSHVADAEAGDGRLDWVMERASGTLALDGLSGDYDVVLYSSLEDNVPYITNDELKLIMAECNIGSNNAGAISALNAVRAGAGLGDYAGGMGDSDLVAELMQQRRYALFGQGHRWVDNRRWGTLSSLPLDRAGDDVWDRFPRPVSEPQ